MHRFFETTWFSWLLFAAAMVGWRSWRLFAGERSPRSERPAHWKDLYREAIGEHDESKLGIRIQKAEGAILLELANQVFMDDRRNRAALQEAMNNLHRLREDISDGIDNNRVA